MYIENTYIVTIYGDQCIITCRYHVMYGDSNAVNNYVKMCIEKFELLNDVQAMADVILTFIEW